MSVSYVKNRFVVALFNINVKLYNKNFEKEGKKQFCLHVRPDGKFYKCP